MAGPIAAAAHAGAAEIDCASLGVLGHAVRSGARAGGGPATLASITLRGCVISELIGGGRIWGTVAAERILVGLCDVALLVEAREADSPLYAARLARTLGRPLAVVPGMLTNPLAAGPLSMLGPGATLIRGPEEVLELLHRAGSDVPTVPQRDCETTLGLSRELTDILDAIGAGADTPEQLAALPGLAVDVLAALGELESLGLVGRLPGCRWTRSDPAGPQSSSSVRFWPTLSGR
jgi:DNA processing protein